MASIQLWTLWTSFPISHLYRLPSQRPMPPLQDQYKGRYKKSQPRNPFVSVYDIFRPLMPGGQGVPPLSVNKNFRLLRGRKTDSMTVVSETSLKWAISHRWLQDLSFEWIQGTNLNLWSEGGRQTLLWGFVRNFFLHNFLQQKKQQHWVNSFL